MQTTITASLALILFGSAGALALQPEAAPRERGAITAQPEGEREGRRGQRMDKAAFLERFDTDGDGELSDAEKVDAKTTLQAEQEERRAEIKSRLLARFDDNGNGELDENEREAIREIVGPMLRERGRRGHHHKRHMHRAALERFDANEDGRLDEDEKARAKAHFEQRKAEMVEAFDADGNGELDQDERRAAKEHHREQRALDANRDGVINELDAQLFTQRAAAGEHIPDINRDGVHDTADVAEILRRIGASTDEGLKG